MPKKKTRRPSTRSVTCQRCGKVIVGPAPAGHSKFCTDCARIIQQEKLREKVQAES